MVEPFPTAYDLPDYLSDPVIAGRAERESWKRGPLGTGDRIMGQESSDTNRLPLALLRRVDEVCLRFEDRWLGGERPDLEAFLTAFAEAERPALLPQLLLLEWDYRARHGEPFFFEQYDTRFPGPRPVVKQAWKCWCKDLERRGGRIAVPPASPGGSGEPIEVALPGHEQVTPLGQGGMGEVFRAFDPRLGRWVAMKQVRLDQSTPGWLARFRLEAEALAKLQHPHIVGAHAYTEQAGQPLLALMRRAREVFPVVRAVRFAHTAD
jgi:hypothetical protein